LAAAALRTAQAGRVCRAYQTNPGVIRGWCHYEGAWIARLGSKEEYEGKGRWDAVRTEAGCEAGKRRRTSKQGAFKREGIGERMHREKKKNEMEQENKQPREPDSLR